MIYILLFIWLYYNYWFAYVDLRFRTEIRASLWWFMICFDVLLNSVCHYFCWEFLLLFLSEMLFYSFLFSHLWFCKGAILDLQNAFLRLSSLLDIWGSLRRIAINSLKGELIGKLIWSWAFLWRLLNYWFNIVVTAVFQYFVSL